MRCHANANASVSKIKATGLGIIRVDTQLTWQQIPYIIIAFPGLEPFSSNWSSLSLCIDELAKSNVIAVTGAEGQAHLEETGLSTF